MDILKLNAAIRETTTKPSRVQDRADGFVPSVLYGGEGESIHLKLEDKVWSKLILDRGTSNLIIDLIIDNSSDEPVLIKVGEIQREPLKGKLLHIDLIRLARGVTDTFEVPVRITGKSMGEKVGGMLSLHLETIEVECMPRNIPESITIDVTNYKLGDVMHVSDLQYDNPDVKITEDASKMIFNIEIPRIIETKVVEEEEDAEGEEGEKAEKSDDKKPETKGKK